jgi:hypothetical protein
VPQPSPLGCNLRHEVSIVFVVSRRKLGPCNRMFRHS